jgi:hypothetical protein
MVTHQQLLVILHPSTAPTNSLVTRNLLAEINANLPSGITISRVQFQFNTAFGSYIQYIFFAGGKATEFHFIITSEDPIKLYG